MRGAATRREQGIDAACQTILHWDLLADAASLATTRVRSRTKGAVRLSEIAGGRCLGRRLQKHRALDGGDYVGMIGTLEGASSYATRGANGRSFKARYGVPPRLSRARSEMRRGIAG